MEIKIKLMPVEATDNPSAAVKAALNDWKDDRKEARSFLYALRKALSLSMEGTGATEVKITIPDESKNGYIADRGWQADTGMPIIMK